MNFFLGNMKQVKWFSEGYVPELEKKILYNSFKYSKNLLIITKVIKLDFLNLNYES